MVELFTFERCWAGARAMHAAGQSLGRCLQSGDCLALTGDLGAGKTLLVQGVATGLGVPEQVRVTSPTFTLLNEYPGGRLTLYHADLYRIEREAELEQLGFEEVAESGGVFAVEWAERFDVVPPDHLVIHIEAPDPSQRRVAIRATGGRSDALARSWSDELARFGAPLRER